MVVQITNKKGFTRTLETVIAIVLITGILNWATTAMNEFSRVPVVREEGKEILNIIENSNIFEDLLNSYDFKAIDSLFYYMLPSSVGHKVEIEKYVNVKVSEESGANITKVVGFTYNFPKGVKEDSINFFSEGYSYDHNVIWAWYELPITVIGSSSDITNQPIFLRNINISAEYPIQNKSLVVYHGNSILDLEDPFSHGEYEGNETHVTVNLTIEIDKIEANEFVALILFYADNRTIWNTTNQFVELSSATELDIIYSNSRETHRGDVLMNMSLKGGEETSTYMSYGVNGGGGLYTSSINEINNTNVTITLEENHLKRGTSPVFQSALLASTRTFNKLLLTDNGLFKITFHTWYT